MMTALFSRDKINTGRQLELDLAKTICIFGMVFVHSFEELATLSMEETSTLYYLFVIVLDVIFGAGTFMTCMGVGIAYSRRESPNRLIKRGCLIFVLAYVLNLARGGLIGWWHYCFVEPTDSVLLIAEYLTFNIDIMQFAGLALITFGTLKKLKLSDRGILAVALAMSVIGSFVRGINTGNFLANNLLGLFLGTLSPMYMEETTACFPLFNWFIIVVLGYLFGKLLMRCKDTGRLYALLLPATAAVIAVYMVLTIPNGYGMMSGDLNLYYHMTIFDAFLCLCGAWFAFSLNHFIGLALSETVKKVVTHMSANINRVYCIHWVIIGSLSTIVLLYDYDGIPEGLLILYAFAVYISSNILAEMYARFLERILKQGKL